MSSDNKRTNILAEMMQRKLSTLIQQEISDPRLSGLVTISGVNISRDLSHAKVYFTVFQDDATSVESILNNAASFLRSALARSSKTRTVPQLHFIYDESIDYGKRLSRLIDEANPPGSDVDE